MDCTLDGAGHHRDAGAAVSSHWRNRHGRRDHRWHDFGRRARRHRLRCSNRDRRHGAGQRTSQLAFSYLRETLRHHGIRRQRRRRWHLFGSVAFHESREYGPAAAQAITRCEFEGRQMPHQHKLLGQVLTARKLPQIRRSGGIRPRMRELVCETRTNSAAQPTKSLRSLSSDRATKPPRFTLQSSLLKRVDGIPDKALELLDLRLSLRNCRIRAGPLAYQSPGSWSLPQTCTTYGTSWGTRTSPRPAPTLRALPHAWPRLSRSSMPTHRSWSRRRFRTRFAQTETKTTTAGQSVRP